MSKLFEPFKLGAIELPNRIVIAPMCQYSAQDGLHDRLAPDPSRSFGAESLAIGATAVSLEGRMTCAVQRPCFRL